MVVYSSQLQVISATKFIIDFVRRMITAIVVTIPSCWYLWPADSHAEAGPLGGHGGHEEHAEESDDSEDKGEEEPAEETEDSGESEESDDSKKSDEPEQSDTSEQSDGSEKSEKSDQSDDSDKSEDSSKEEEGDEGETPDESSDDEGDDKSKSPKSETSESKDKAPKNTGDERNTNSKDGVSAGAPQKQKKGETPTKSMSKCFHLFILDVMTCKDSSAQRTAPSVALAPQHKLPHTPAVDLSDILTRRTRVVHWPKGRTARQRWYLIQPVMTIAIQPITIDRGTCHSRQNAFRRLCVRQVQPGAGGIGRSLKNPDFTRSYYNREKNTIDKLYLYLCCTS